MSEKEHKSIGGNLEQAQKGEIKLDLKSSLEEAWKLSQNTKRALLQGAMFIFALGFLLILLLQNWFDVSNLQEAPLSMRLSLNILLTVISAPLITAMMLMGMGHSVGRSTAFFQVVKPLLGSVLLVLAALMIAAIVDIALTLLILPGLYLSMATGFTLPLIIDKKLPPSQAIMASIKVFNQYWRPLLVFYLASMILFTLGMFTLGFAYIWLIPLYFNLKGVLYRELFGIDIHESDLGKSNKQRESIFHA